MTVKESKLKWKPEWRDVSLPDSPPPIDQNNFGETFVESQQQRCETFVVTAESDVATNDVPVTIYRKDVEQSIVETVVEENFEEDNFDSFGFENVEKADTFQFDTLPVKNDSLSFEVPKEKDDSFFSFEATGTQTTAMKLDTLSLIKVDNSNLEKTDKSDTFSIENVLKECEEDAAKAEEKSPEPNINFSLNLSSLDLTLSPERHVKTAKPQESVAPGDFKCEIVVDNVEVRRVSSGTYVRSPNFANLRDVASPNRDIASPNDDVASPDGDADSQLEPLQENVMELSGVAHFSTTAKTSSGNAAELATDESLDEISLLVSLSTLNPPSKTLLC